ncbi:MAG: VWA domain-containing protein [Planctomycetes bacterium]|nr:VWA domain-containing protein [Planctomycetota bacterium]
MALVGFALVGFFGLWTTTLLAGIGAVSVPIIIHLLNRRRYKIVVWAAMRFLLAAQKQNTRRIRLEQIILLLVRTAIVALVVFAMASVMPWMENVWAAIWPEGGGKNPMRISRTHHVIVLDGSLSMTLKDEGKSLFDRARQQAASIVKDGLAGDGFSVLLMKDTPVWIVGEASPDARRVIREIEALKPAHGNASVASMLNMVAAKVADGAGRFPNQNVYFLTDLQRSSWAGLQQPKSAKEDLAGDSKEKTPWSDIQTRARAVFVDLGRDGVGNLAVTDLRLDAPFVTTGAEIIVKAMIQNFGQKVTERRIEVLLGKARATGGDQAFSPRVVGQDVVEVRPGAPQPFQFGLRFPGPGVYALTVKLEPDDLELDDSRTIIVTVKDTIPILLVNGKPAGDRYERATEYLRLALQPFPTGAEPKIAPLRPKVISNSQFIDVPDADLADYDCIFLCDVPGFGVGELRRFESHLRRGGGLVFSLGDRAADHLETYNRLLFKQEQGILPAKLVQRILAPADHIFTFDAEELSYGLPPLQAFSDSDDRLAIRTARFRQFIEAKPAADSKARTILSFMPQLEPDAKGPIDKALPTSDPALMEWNPPLPRDLAGPAARGKDGKLLSLAPTRYRGKVLLFTSTFNMDWNSWPGSPSFGAMMQEVARVAVSGKLRDQAHVVGQVLEESLPGGGGEVDAVVTPPAGAQGSSKVRTTLVEDVNIFRWADTDVSGIYLVTMAGAPKEHLFAVNVPASTPDQRGSESDLSRVDRSELEKLYPGWDFQLVTDPRQAEFTKGLLRDDIDEERIPVGPDIAHYALILVFLLLLAEVVLAWKFGHYSAVEGATAPAAVGRFWPIFVAAIAGCVFLLGAFVLIHAGRTSDFLGFLPESARGWMERTLGVPPATAGEGTRWDLEHLRFLPNIGDETYLAAFLALAALILIVLIYRVEAPTVRPSYRALLGFLRVTLVLLTLAVLLPQLQIRFDRQGWPDVVLLIDDSRSMGEPDSFQEDATRDRARQLGESIRKKLLESLPAKIKGLEAEIAAKSAQAAGNPDVHAEVERFSARLDFWKGQLAQVNSASWRPTRLQLVLEILADPDRDWLAHLINRRHFKLHIYHLDLQGRAIKLADAEGPAGELVEADPAQLDRAQKAVAGLEAEGNDSRLGTALRQVIDQYRGSSLAAAVMFTDGVTTRDETIAQVGEYAAQKAVPLFFVGVGEDNEIRDLRLHDLQVEDTVYVGDRIVFKAFVTGQGYKDMRVPVILKVQEKDKKEKELDRTMVKIDPQGKSVPLKLLHTPTDVGRRTYIIQVEAPKSDRPEKGPNPTNLRLERTIDVIDTKMIRVLYVEGQPRYEFRFLKSLLERENPDAKKNKSVELRVLLLDGDASWPETDKSALVHFPATR